MKNTHSLAPRKRPSLLARTLLLLALAIVLLAAYKGIRLYSLAQALRSDLAAIGASAQTPSLAALPVLRAQVAKARADARDLQGEAQPLLPITRRLGWVPRYGADLAAAGTILDIASSATEAADEALSAFAPLAALPADREQLGQQLVRQLALAQPQLIAARQALDRAIAAQQRLPIDQLSPSLRQRLARLSLLPSARDGLSLALIAPRLLGAEHEQSYLLMALNQDELRAGGGFITAAGLISFANGKRTSLSMHNSLDIDNQEAHLYPPPPEPMQRYMDIPQWVFRDTNWSPDFPTSAAQALHFYSLGQNRDADGVVAFDQTALQQLLGATGPILLDGVGEPISKDNLIAYIRNARNGPQPDKTDWQQRKGAFISQLGALLFAKLEHDPASLNIAQLVPALRRMLDERHVQIFLKDPDAAALLESNGWDGAVRPGTSDFLMVVDSNVGYNKVNPNIRQQIAYQLDLRSPSAPRATATITYTHLLPGPRGCKSPAAYADGYSYGALMTRCYADFVRVLVPGGSQLTSSKTHPTSGAWTLLGNADDGAVSLGQGEATTWELSTFLVVPIGESRTISFSYRLPPSVLAREGDLWRYQLKLQKQAGTDAIPFVVQLQLPEGAILAGGSPSAPSASPTISGQLAQDQSLTFMFRAH